MFHFLKKHFNTAAFMSECLPTVTDIELVDCRMTGSQTLSNESDEVLPHSAYLLYSDSLNIKMISGDESLCRWIIMGSRLYVYYMRKKRNLIHGRVFIISWLPFLVGTPH